VVAVYPFDTEDEAVALANDTAYGLTASVWTTDTSAGARVAARIDAGGVGVNDAYAATFGSHSAPAGGWKDSGLGRRHGSAGLLRFTEPQTVATQRLMALDARWGLPRSLHGKIFARSIGWIARLPR